MDQQQSRTNSGWAVASFVFGILSLAMVIAGITAIEVGFDSYVINLFPISLLASLPLGFVCGVIALVQIGRNRTRLKGDWMAAVGAIPGGLGLLVIGMIVFAPHGHGQRTSCLNNLKQIGTAIAMYDTDWDDKFPLVSGPGREFERVYGWTWNYRTNSRGGERRWFQNLVGPYAKNKRVFMCPVVGRDGTWKIPGKGTARFLDNRHGGVRTPADPKYIHGPFGSSNAGLKLENDPPTSYWFNAYVTKAGEPDKVISGRSEAICDKTADAPMVWDTPCGFDNGDGDAQIAHGDVFNVCYADGHCKPYQIPNPKVKEWLDSDFRVLHGSDGWYLEK